MNVAHMKTRDQGATRRIIIEIDIRLSPPGKFNAAHQTLIVSTDERQRTHNLSILEMNCRAGAVNFTLQTNFTRALRGGLRAAHRQRHRRLIQIVEHRGEKRIQKLFVNCDRGFGGRSVARSTIASSGFLSAEKTE